MMLTFKQQKHFDGLTEYRAYFFGNMYLSSIQQGIQALHVTSEMYTKYTTSAIHKRILYRWGINDKTVILLNGGYSETIQTVYDALKEVCPRYGFPFAKSHEVWDCPNPLPHHNVSGTWWDYYHINQLLEKAPLAS